MGRFRVVAVLVGFVLCAGFVTGTASHANALGGIAVYSISPSAGPASGGTTVTITGTGFTVGFDGRATGVKFGATDAVSFTVDSSYSITAVSPPGTGLVDITVDRYGSVSPVTEVDQFHYQELATTTTTTTTVAPTTTVAEPAVVAAIDATPAFTG
ncbi:MAG: IPT/TIG domain-containing protein [Actinomycetes bacterium]